MRNTKSINILISYDQCIVADGLRAMLHNNNKYLVSALKKNGEIHSNSINWSEIDLLIMEIAEVSRNSLYFINQLHKKFPKIKILIISGIPPQELLKSLILVINGYLIRSCSSKKLFLAIHEIFETGKYICSKLIPILFHEEEKDSFNIKLTSREKEILFLQFVLKNNNEIAKRLHISETTVRTHVKNIKHKFGNFNQIQMMRYACSNTLHKEHCLPLCPNCKFFANRNECKLRE